MAPPSSNATLLALPYLRFALLLSLSTLDDAEWAATDDLAAQLSIALAGMGPLDVCRGAGCDSDRAAPGPCLAQPCS